MSCFREYHNVVGYSISASVALFAVLALPHACAQINGVPSSVTSQGFGGRQTNGTPPSVTSVGPKGFIPNRSITFSTGNVFRDHDGLRHHHPRNFVQYPIAIYPYPYYYGYDQWNTEDNNDTMAEDDSDYQGGPTIFDRRGSGPNSYIPPVRDTRPRSAPPADASQEPAVADDEAPPPEPTVLVFKDGHKLEVGNYAIVGATLFDLTPGHHRKIALSDLDLNSTQQQNDDRGIIFRLPSASQGS